MPDQRLLECDGVPVPITAKAIDVLVMLVQHRARALATEEILATVWSATVVEDGNVAQQVHLLRKALAAAGDCIATVPRHGYRFSASVVERDDDGFRPAATRHCLVWDGRAYPLRSGATVLGRADDADVQVLLPSVSRHHARVVVSGDAATSEDMNSKHGLWRGVARVNGAVALKNGDEIRLGTAALVYRFTKPDDTTA